MKIVFLFVVVIILLTPISRMAANTLPDLDSGITAFQERRWRVAMKAFLDVLDKNPQNRQAHTYLDLVLKEMQSEQQSDIQDTRLNVLASTARRLEDHWIDAQQVENAILDTTQADERMRQERWRAVCQQAEVERQLRHWVSAYDLVFRVLAENSSQIQAQQILSDLQSDVHGMISKNTDLPSEMKYALEGFDAYGQADYAAAVTAWQKASLIVQQSYSMEEATKHLGVLHFEPYRKIAQAHLDEDRELVQTHAMFNQACGLYENGRYLESLQAFRQVAILNPEFPQLGTYLARAESAVEKDRARRLGEEKQKEIAQLFEQGVSALQQTQYLEAEKSFQRVLSLDATHPQARSYLSLVQAEIHRRHDPKAAEQHYEAGLIAYASGKLEEATREWMIATRMNPDHQKAHNALTKVQKELAFNHEPLP